MAEYQSGTKSEFIKDSNSTPNDDSFDTTGLLLDYLSNWKWFVLSVVAVLVGAYFYIATIVPQYQVDASLYLNNQNNSSSRAAALDASSQFFELKDYIDQTELEILKSRNNVIQIVDSLKMYYSYWREGKLRDIPLYQNNAVCVSLDSVSLANLTKDIKITVSNGKGENKYDVTAHTEIGDVDEDKEFENVELPLDVELTQGTVTVDRVKHVPELEGKEIIYITNPHKAADRVSRSLSLAFEEKATTIVRISYKTDLPQLGVDVINTLIEFYNRQLIEDQNLSAVQTEAFIIERLAMITDELNVVEQRLQNYRQTHNIADLGQQMSSAYASKTSSEKELAQIEAEMQIVQSIENEVSRADVYTTLPTVSNDNSLNAVIEAYNKKVAQLTRALESSTQDNPTVRSLQELLTLEKTRILQSLAASKNNINARRKSIATIEDRSVGTLSSMPTIDKGLQEILRDQQVKDNIYTFLLQRREEIALQKSLATPTARLIDNPSSDAPVSPNKKIIYILAFLLGLAVPGGIIFLKRYFFHTYKDAEELRRLTRIPIIGEISADKSKNMKPIVVGEGVTTSISELFRLLRNSINMTSNGARKKVILITSAVSGEGKTFISTNLAMSYALTGKKVVVVGLDIRRPVLAHKFGLSNSMGVTTFLSGQISDIDQITHQSEESPNLFIVPAGPVPPNPNELLLNDNMNKFMEQLRDRFDIVILDTAPIGVISDTFIIIPYSDIQLYVTRASFSTKTSLKVLHQSVHDERLPNPYIVLNGVDINAGSYSYRKYGHYYRSGEKQRYGYGYVDSKNK